MDLSSKSLGNSPRRINRLICALSHIRNAHAQKSIHFIIEYNYTIFLCQMKGSDQIFRCTPHEFVFDIGAIVISNKHNSKILR